MISKRTMRVTKLVFLVASGTGFLPYKCDTVHNFRIRRSERFLADYCSNAILSWYIGFCVVYKIILIFNMATRVTKIPEMILGTFVLSILMMLTISFLIILLVRDEFVALVNAVFRLTETLGK